MTNLLSSLDHPAYHIQTHLRGYTGKSDVFMVHSDVDAARILRITGPNWTQIQHAELAAQHMRAAQKQAECYAKLLNDAALETFGRPYSILDYRISAIACDEFTQEKKTALRFAARSMTNHEKLARAHALSARRHTRASP